MEFTILLAAALAIAVFFLLIGMFISATFDLTMHVSKKEDYEAKVKQFEGLIADLEEKLEDAQKDISENLYNPNELFPPNVYKDYGIPKKLK